MKEYKITKYEQDVINNIKQEIESHKELSQLEKAYLIYYRMCQFYKPNERFYYGTNLNKIDSEYNMPTSSNGRATCLQENSGIAEAMRQLNIAAEAFKYNHQHHVDGAFIIDGNTYFFDASADLSRAKTGRLIRHFGNSFNEIEKKRSFKYMKFIEPWINYNNANKENEGINENQIREMNAKLGLDFKGITTNDFMIKISEVVDNPKKMRSRFKSETTPEQIEELVDILIKYPIPNDTQNEIEFMEASEYYTALFSIFPSRYVDTFEGYEKTDNCGGRKQRNIFIISKDEGFVLYEFEQDQQRLVKLNNKEIENPNIISKYLYSGSKSLTENERSLKQFLKRMKDSKTHEDR